MIELSDSHVERAGGLLDEASHLLEASDAPHELCGILRPEFRVEE
jgi:hypothetical protein